MTATNLTAARSGVYRTPPDVDAVRASARAGGLHWIEADLAAVRTKAGLFSALAPACEFPAGFGMNWDALADSLSDFSWRSAGGYGLHLIGASAARRALGADWAAFLEVLRTTAHEWQTRGKPFVVFMDGAALPQWR